MTTERWRQVEDLFHSTLDRAPRDRAAFLDAACADDRTLREQVEGLLESFDEAGDFIEKPREILSPAPLRVSLATPSRDDRQIYLSVISPESDIQMLSLK